jgi:hypothetical protein
MNIIQHKKPNDSLNIHEKIKILEIISEANALNNNDKNALNFIKLIFYNEEINTQNSSKKLINDNEEESDIPTLYKLRNTIVHEFNQITFKDKEIALIQNAYHSLIKFTNIDPPNILKEINYSIKQLQLENQNNENN